MLEWLLPALAVAQLAARKTLVSACACSVSLFTTTCALCVARLQTRRRWLFVSPSPSLIVHCEPYNSYTTVCATSLLARATSIAPTAPQPTIAHRALTFTAQSYCTIRSQSDNSAIVAIHIATEGNTARRKHFRGRIVHSKHCVLQSMQIVPN